jgi:hypothetical protein
MSMKAEVITTGEEDRFIWVRVQFAEEDVVPSGQCEVTIALRREDIQALDAEGMRKQAITEATLFLERVLSSRFA